ncbi:acrEF/envCD operon transcriptional regulator [Escherichia marmotae]|uniref:acrEF/envCD operon transcriptional regulator n=1 Tax=Escherichia marmotae TaxID=1499973 RepID=UPI001C9AA67C|nr:acrEF/envCD operon transcriptional regulator [Escherichia marmotae]MBY7379871.1 acrEF/envCD operon transcriptional regulator [Escherichia marmotae]MBY7385030.1 acrEF/envCD operon transcriptional regulator [Escherichia marmotae]MBY7485962.1 acrEF/envCD operon transcriptional regulator [Escherichia marmotae]MEC9689970.1 acrEF/envCD operon transcriptional regulator [Escherichia marmotae]MED9113418.1 acrEF/envCD operon transcriptional regulator [Escherichia marmotae]
MAKRTKAEALKTRQELIETAIAQFAQHGVSKTTLNDIADAANVTRGAIYWHFENKTQLFNEMWLQQPSLRELIQERLTAGAEHNPFQQLREKLIVGLQYIAEIPRQQALLQILYHKCEFNDEMLAEAVIREKMGFNPQILREILQACQQQGCVEHNLDLDVVMIIIEGAFCGIVKNWLMNMAGYDLYKHAPALVDNVLRMFIPDKNVAKLIHKTNELDIV